MSTYQHILLTVDLSEDSLQVGQRAVEIAERLGARITVLHVVEFVPVEPMGEALLPAVPIEEELVANAKRRLDELAARLGLEDSPKSVEVGSIKAEGGVVALFSPLKIAIQPVSDAQVNPGGVVIGVYFDCFLVGGDSFIKLIEFFMGAANGGIDFFRGVLGDAACYGLL